MAVATLPQDVLSRLNVLGLETLKEFSFAVEIDGDLPGSRFAAGFDAIEGLGDRVEIREIKEGGYPGRHRFPRNSQQNAITLRRGITLSRSLWKWYQEAIMWIRGKPDYRRNLSIYMFDYVRTPAGLVPYEVWQWDLYFAWLSEWNGPHLGALSERIAVESIVIQHTGLAEARGLFSGKAGEVLGLIGQ